MQETHSCHWHASCIDTLGSFLCKCDTGFTGNGSFCYDVDECKIESSVASSNNTNGTNSYCDDQGYCINIPGSYYCGCNQGFLQDLDNIGCSDLNECAEGVHTCALDARSENTLGTYVCHCHEGYTGNGDYCEDVNDCEHPDMNECDENADCTNSDGNYFCQCRVGYSGTGKVCFDVDECQERNHNCDYNANCTNIAGSFYCTCRDGFMGNGVECEDRDECSLGEYVCQNNKDCVNLPGGYHCVCLTKYDNKTDMCLPPEPEKEGPNDGAFSDGVLMCVLTGVCGEGDSEDKSEEETTEDEDDLECEETETLVSYTDLDGVDQRECIECPEGVEPFVDFNENKVKCEEEIVCEDCCGKLCVGEHIGLDFSKNKRYSANGCICEDYYCDQFVCEDDFTRTNEGCAWEAIGCPPVRWGACCEKVMPPFSVCSNDECTEINCIDANFTMVTYISYTV